MEPKWEFKLTIQTDVLAFLFTVASLFLASGAIMARFGRLVGIVYWAVGILMIIMQFVRLLAYYRRTRAES